MSDAIGPGMLVQCVKPSATLPKFSPVVGGRYFVSEAFDVLTPCKSCGGYATIWLADGPNPPPPCGGWCPELFRPIRSDITSITRLLTQPIDAGMVGA
jgi:hypothetical protein